jgi:Chlorophyll A-B binding protein
MTSETPSNPKPTPNSENKSTPSFGWNSYSEQVNGRFAMVGFVLLLILEFFTRQDFFTWLGFPR